MHKNSNIALALALAAAFSSMPAKALHGINNGPDALEAIQTTALEIMQLQAEFSSAELIAGLLSCSSNCNQHNHNNNHNGFHNNNNSNNNNSNSNNGNEEKEKRTAFRSTAANGEFVV